MPEPAIPRVVRFYAYSAGASMNLGLYRQLGPDLNSGLYLVWRRDLYVPHTGWVDIPYFLPPSEGGQQESLEAGTYYLAWTHDSFEPILGFVQGSPGDGWTYKPELFPGYTPPRVNSSAIQSTDETWSIHLSYWTLDQQVNAWSAYACLATFAATIALSYGLIRPQKYPGS